MKHKRVPLGDVATLINGRAYKKHEMLRQGKYPLLRVGNFFTNQEWYYSDLELDEHKYCDNGDLLYAWSASFGPRIWEGSKTIYHYHIWKVLIDFEKIDKNFLFFVLANDVESIKTEQTNGSTMAHVTKGNMEKRHIPLPSLKEQRRIAGILSTWEKSINAYDRLIALKETEFSAVLKDLFSTKSTTRKHLSQLCKIRTGKKDVNSTSEGGEYPFFSCAKKILSTNCFEFDCEAILIAGNGEVGLSKYYNGKFDAYQRTYVLSDFSELPPRYIFAYIKTFFETHCLNEKQTSAMSYIKLGTLKDYEIPVLSEQQHLMVTSLFDGYEKLLSNLRYKRDLLKKQKQGLMQQLLA